MMFNDWLHEELNNRGWSNLELSKRSGLAATSKPKPKPVDPEMETLAKKYGPKPKPLLKGDSELGAMVGASGGGLFHEVFKPDSKDTG